MTGLRASTLLSAYTKADKLTKNYFEFTSTYPYSFIHKNIIQAIEPEIKRRVRQRNRFGEAFYDKLSILEAKASRYDEMEREDNPVCPDCGSTSNYIKCEICGMGWEANRTEREESEE